MSIPVLAAGDFALAFVGFVFTVYQAMLSNERPHAVNASRWVATISACATVNSFADGLQYMSSGESCRVLSQLELLTYLVLTYAIARFAAAEVGRQYPVPGWVMTPALLALTALTASTTVFPMGLETVRLGWLETPYLQPASTAAYSALLGLLLATNAASIAWLVRRAKDRAAALAWGLGLGAWIVGGVVDTLTVSGVGLGAPMFFMEYGMFFLALSIVAVDARRYAALLEQSEALVSRIDAGVTNLLDRVPMPTTVLRDGRFVYANPAVASLLGYDAPADLLGASLATLVHPEELDASRQRAMLAASGQAVPLREVRLRRRDGTWAALEVVGVPLTFRGEPAVVSMGLDVSARRALTARMMTMDRMIAVGTLAAGVAHEINNPLAYVTANLHFAREELALVDPGPAHAAQVAEILAALREAHLGADRAAQIVRDLRSLSRSHAEERAVVDVVASVESACNIASNEIRHRARLVKDLGPVPPVLGSTGRLSQVFVNLLVNAAQAIAPGAAHQNEVTVRTRTGERGAAVVEISDTGAGIAPGHRAQVFDAFFTTKPVGTGTGLGLSICQSLVRGLGGEISFQTELGQGTTFRVVLPAAWAAAPALVEARPTPQRPASPRARVLFIDDEPLVSAAVQRALGARHDVVPVSCAREALHRLEAGEAFDVVFCDLMMPDFSGTQLFAALQRRLPHVARRVVFVTGGAFTAEASALLASTKNRTLEKPLVLDAVLGAIDELLSPLAAAPA